MDPVANAASTATTGTTSSSSSKTTTSEKTAKESFSTLFADAEKKLKDGEKLSKVDGHSYAKITGGTRNGEFINLSGNGRNGQAFDLITRNGHTFHAYGTGKDRVVVEVGAAKKTGGSQAS